MSYGERDNDDFLVHYGFVPEANPHDSVLLFSGAFDAVDWGLSRILSAEDGADKAQVSRTYSHPIDSLLVLLLVHPTIQPFFGRYLP